MKRCFNRYRAIDKSFINAVLCVKSYISNNSILRCCIGIFTLVVILSLEGCSDVPSDVPNETFDSAVEEASSLLGIKVVDDSNGGYKFSEEDAEEKINNVCENDAVLCDLQGSFELTMSSSEEERLDTIKEAYFDKLAWHSTDSYNVEDYNNIFESLVNLYGENYKEDDIYDYIWYNSDINANIKLSESDSRINIYWELTEIYSSIEPFIAEIESYQGHTYSNDEGCSAVYNIISWYEDIHLAGFFSDEDVKTLETICKESIDYVAHHSDFQFDYDADSFVDTIWTHDDLRILVNFDFTYETEGFLGLVKYMCYSCYYSKDTEAEKTYFNIIYNYYENKEGWESGIEDYCLEIESYTSKESAQLTYKELEAFLSYFNIEDQYASQLTELSASIEQKSDAEVESKYAEKEKQEPAIGMTEEEVKASTWGSPKDINTTITAYGTHEQWVYSNNRYIYFDDGIVTGIQY